MHSILFGLLPWVPPLPGPTNMKSLHGETEAGGGNAGDPTRRVLVVLENEICSQRHQPPSLRILLCPKFENWREPSKVYGRSLPGPWLSSCSCFLGSRDTSADEQ